MKARRWVVSRAFTLVELLVVIAIIAILAAILLPVLSHSKMKARNAQCINQLHQFGRGANLWANEHEGRYPWAVDTDDGGSKGTTIWADHVRAMQKELENYNILICPFDKDRKPAPDWENLAGLDNASYFLGLTAAQSRLTMLSGDDGFTGSGGGPEPSWNNSAGTSIDFTFESGGGSRRAHSGGRGNILLTDGSVHSWTSRQVRDQIALELATGSTNVVLSKPHGTL
jgi:prepilin-type N-terminal cleavage/methylation domain-containing protein/prepilin-type processing-associated H-X9-DG protein